MNSVRRLYTLLYSSAAFALDFASGAELSAACAAWKAFSQSAYFFLNSASLIPFAGETRATQSPTRRSSLPSPFTSATQTRVALVGPVRSLSRTGWPGLTGGLGFISCWNGLRSGNLHLP